jgi:hypothetical protein
MTEINRANGGTKVRPMGNRYFVVNRWQGKNGVRSSYGEFSSHEAANRQAFFMVANLLDLTGEVAEEFHVFVGSKKQLVDFMEKQGLRLELHF